MRPELFDKMQSMEDSHWWFAARRQIILSLIRKKISLPERAVILDAGCGTGANLKFLSELGSVIGMDVDDKALALAEKKGVGRIVRGSLPDSFSFKENMFDLVVLLDVLEHLEDDRESLVKLAGSLKPGGFLLITVPAFPFLWSSHDEANHHKRRYLLPALKQKVVEANLRPVYISYFNVWLFPLVAALRWLKIQFGGNEKADDLWLPPKIINAALRVVFESEKFFVGRIKLPFGVSIIACARKPGGSR